MFIEKLKPFIHRKSARQRIILYLIAKGYRFNQLSAMTADELKVIDVPDDNGLLSSKHQVLSTLHDEHLVFTYPSGRKMGEGDFFRILMQSSMKVLGRSITVDEFIEHLQSAD